MRFVDQPAHFRGMMVGIIDHFRSTLSDRLDFRFRCPDKLECFEKVKAGKLRKEFAPGRYRGIEATKQKE